MRTPKRGESSASAETHWGNSWTNRAEISPPMAVPDQHGVLRVQAAEIEDTLEIGHVFGKVVDVGVISAGLPMSPEVGKHHVPAASDDRFGHVLIALAVLGHSVDEKHRSVGVTRVGLIAADKQRNPVIRL